MKTPRLALLSILSAAGLLASPAQAQNTARDAADMLRALNIQIGEAQLAGNKKRVLELQNRYNSIQKEWGVQPTPAKRPVPVQTTWSSTMNGNGKITGYEGGNIRVRRASATLPNFRDAYGQVNASGRGAVLKFTDAQGYVYTYTGSWTYRDRIVSVKVGDGQGGVYTGSFTIVPNEGLSTVSLVGQGSARGYNVSFAN